MLKIKKNEYGIPDQLPKEDVIRSMNADEKLDSLVSKFIFNVKEERPSIHYSTDELALWMVKTQMAGKGWQFDEMPGYAGFVGYPLELMLKNIAFYKDIDGDLDIVRVEVDPPSGGIAEATCKAALIAILHDMERSNN